MPRPYFLTCCLALLVLTSGCDTIFGSKSNPMTDEILDEGRTDPGLFDEVNYVPFLPFFTLGGDGSTLDAPKDVYVGYDRLMYVVDARGLHILDRAGRPQALISEIAGKPLRAPSSVIQDRRFHLYVTARRDTTIEGTTWDLPVVYHLADVTTGGMRVVDILWHPFDDGSRRLNRPDPIPTDEEVQFTGVAVLPDNSIYVSRRGPVNNPSSIIRPHNLILEFSPEGLNTEAIRALNAQNPSLLSSVNPSDVMTLAHPPQRTTYPQSLDFFVAQSPYVDGTGEGAAPDSLRYGVLSIDAVLTPDGIVYQPDASLLQASLDPTAGEGFLYEEFRFNNPTGLAYAADGTGYIYVTDAGSDSLYVFTSSGIEGVAPPAGAEAFRPVPVSFGGTGDGAKDFRNPNGAAYFEEVVYVADTGNNRISRFKLNTDFE